MPWTTRAVRMCPRQRLHAALYNTRTLVLYSVHTCARELQCGGCSYLPSHLPSRTSIQTGKVVKPTSLPGIPYSTFHIPPHMPTPHPTRANKDKRALAAATTMWKLAGATHVTPYESYCSTIPSPSASAPHRSTTEALKQQASERTNA